MPDYRFIAEIMLFAEGFREARVLGFKMVDITKATAESVSSQQHYDFGMRYMKTVLTIAGRAKRAELDELEAVLLLRVMKQLNGARFLKTVHSPTFLCRPSSTPCTAPSPTPTPTPTGLHHL